MLFIPCTLRQLPEPSLLDAARTAISLNPLNRPALGEVLPPARIAVLTTRYWGADGVALLVGFLDSPPLPLRQKILAHMNAWGAGSNVRFVGAPLAYRPQVRITRTPGGGHWSYLGTDVLGIPPAAPTMNLDGFTVNTPDSEFYRVVRHETGHTLGFPHEHMRRDLVARLDPAKTVAYFGAVYGWGPAVVQQQVLTPLEESDLYSLAGADQTSIMCYQLPGTITTDAHPITGGTDIDLADHALASAIYPLPKAAGAP